MPSKRRLYLLLLDGRKFQVFVDKSVQIAVHNRLYVACFVVGAMVFDHCVRAENVAANLASPLDFFELSADLRSLFFTLALALFDEFGTEHLHCDFAVLNLTSFILTRNDYARRDMRNADCRLGFVDVLSACTRGTICVHLQVFGANFDF